MDQLTAEPEPTSISTEYLARQHPIDALYVTNPEFATVAWANKAGWLSPQVLQILPALRTAQAHENIEFLRAMVQKHAIDADERKNKIVQQTLEGITRIQQEGRITVEELHTKGVVQGEQVRAQCAIDALKLKYTMNCQMLTQQIEGQKYLSEIQLKAVYREAEAYKEAIVLTERIRAESQDKRTEAGLIAIIKQAELSYRSKLVEVENLRKIESKKDVTAIINTYLFLQSQILRDSLSIEAEKTKSTAESYKASYGTLTDVIKAGAEVLKSRQAKKITIHGKTSHGNIDVDLEAT